MHPSQYSTLKLNLRIAATRNEKLFFFLTVSLAIIFITAILYDLTPQIAPHVLQAVILIFAAAFFVWMQFFDFHLKKTNTDIIPLYRDELFHRWRKYSYSEQLTLIFAANLPLYRIAKVSLTTKVVYQLLSLRVINSITTLLNTNATKKEFKHEHLYEITRLYNAFTTIPTIQKLLDQNTFFNLEDIENFENTSHLFTPLEKHQSECSLTPFSKQTESARITQLQNQLNLAEKHTIASARFLLLMINDPAPISDVTVTSYKSKYNELLNSDQCPFSKSEMPSQNFIIKKLRKGLPPNFWNDANSIK